MARVFGVLALVLAAVSAKTQWYSAYDLTSEQTETLTQNGCFRGTYGGLVNNDFHNSRSLSLFTCPLAGETAFAETEDNAFLCVVELTAAEHSQKALTLVAAHGQSKVLFVGRREFILVSNNATIQHEKPEICSPIHFAGLVDNTLFVPREAFVVPDPAPVDHPAYIRSVLKTQPLVANPIIEDLIRQFNRQRTIDQVVALSTGPDGTNTRITRNSYAIQVGRAGCADATWKCANTAAQYVVDTLNNYFRQSNYPGQWSVYTNTFRADMCNNVVLDIISPINPTKWILTGAHLDSRNTGSGTGATGIAPGADDNGTGSAVHLELARVIASSGTRFENSIRLMWFCGEEQGLLGSAALATAYANANPRLDVIGMFNMDMIGYTNPPNGVVLSFMTGSATRWLSESCQEFSRTYIPSMAVGFTQACCSDQQSFFSRGFAAAGIFETPTPRVVYPNYHQTSDQWNNGNINYDQVYNFGQAISACAMEYAVPLRNE